MENIFKEPLFIIFFTSVGACIFILTLINIKACIILLFFAVALSPKINIAGLPLRVEDFFMVMLFFSWFARLAIRKENLPSTPLNWPIIVYLLVCFVSTTYGYYNGTTKLFSSDSSMSAVFHLLKKVQIFIIAYIITANINTKKDLRQFIKYILLASTVLAIFGIKQSLTEIKISGPIGEGANTLGMFFVFIVIITIGLFFIKPAPFNKFLIGLCILLYLYVILRSLSRVSYVTFIIAVLILGIFVERRLLFLSIFLVLIVFVFAPPVSLERISTLKGIFDSGEYFTSWEIRVWAWKAIPPIVMRESPLFGFGLASAPLCYAESGLVTDLYFTGILGILAFFWLYKRVFKVTLYLMRSNDEIIKTLALYSMGGFIAYLIGMISGPIFTAIRTANIFWIFVGLLIGAYNLSIGNKLNDEKPT